VNPKLTTVAFGSSSARLLSLYVDGSTISGASTITIDDSIDYTGGYSNGDGIY